MPREHEFRSGYRDAKWLQRESDRASLRKRARLRPVALAAGELNTAFADASLETPGSVRRTPTTLPAQCSPDRGIRCTRPREGGYSPGAYR